jgi:type IV pilus assembly PilN-like protein
MTRTLPRLDLELCPPRGAATWAAWALLAIAVAFISDLGVSYHSARREAAAAETRLARAEHAREGSSASRRRGGAHPAAEEIREGRATYLRLATPWPDLFQALERAAVDDILLLAVEPDPRAGTVLISGSAKDYAAVLAYVSALQREKLLTRVYLVRHEIRQDDRERAAAFSVSATWKEVER